MLARAGFWSGLLGSQSRLTPPPLPPLLLEAAPPLIPPKRSLCPTSGELEMSVRAGSTRIPPPLPRGTKPCLRCCAAPLGGELSNCFSRETLRIPLPTPLFPFGLFLSSLRLSALCSSSPPLLLLLLSSAMSLISLPSRDSVDDSPLAVQLCK